MILIIFPWLHLYFSKALFHNPVLPKYPSFPTACWLKGEVTSQTISLSVGRCLREIYPFVSHSVPVPQHAQSFPTPPRSAVGLRCGCQYCSSGKRWSARFTGCFLLFLAGVTQHIKVTSKCVLEQKSILLWCQLPHFLGFYELLTVYSRSIHCMSLPARRTPAPVCWREAEMLHLSLIYWSCPVSFFRPEHSGIWSRL